MKQLNLQNRVKQLCQFWLMVKFRKKKMPPLVFKSKNLGADITLTRDEIYGEPDVYPEPTK